MSYSKPSGLAYVLKNKLLSAVHGITDTFNYIISCFDNISTDDYIEIENLDMGEPKLTIKEEKMKALIEETINEKLDDISDQVASKIQINGGSGANIEVTRDGNTFTINVHYL